MISQNIHIPTRVSDFNQSELQNGVWLALLHVQRIPPHIGLMFNGNYNSITIKEHEYNISSELLIKTINQKKIKTVFVNLVKHPVFSLQHQLEIFQEQMKDFGSVEQNKITCTSPIKLFLKEFYGIHSDEKELFFNLFQKLNQNNFVNKSVGVNIELSNGVELPFYTNEELNEKIKNERKPYYND